MNQFITIGGGDFTVGDFISLADYPKIGQRSIDLDRFISAKIVPKDGSTSTCYLIVRLHGTGWLQYLKDCYVEVCYNSEEKAKSDYDLLMADVNKWKLQKK